MWVSYTDNQCEQNNYMPAGLRGRANNERKVNDMEAPKYFYFRVKTVNHGTALELENASDADVVEVVRCKDCKYARLTNDGSCKYCDIWFPDEAEYMDGDYYCASAERKSNG